MDTWPAATGLEEAVGQMPLDDDLYARLEDIGHDAAILDRQRPAAVCHGEMDDLMRVVAREAVRRDDARHAHRLRRSTTYMCATRSRSCSIAPTCRCWRGPDRVPRQRWHASDDEAPAHAHRGVSAWAPSSYEISVAIINLHRTREASAPVRLEEQRQRHAEQERRPRRAPESAAARAARTSRDCAPSRRASCA